MFFNEQNDLTRDEEKENESQNEQLVVETIEEDKNNSWSDPATKMLISLLKDLRPKVGNSIWLKTKQKCSRKLAAGLKCKAIFTIGHKSKTKQKGLIKHLNTNFKRIKRLETQECGVASKMNLKSYKKGDRTYTQKYYLEQQHPKTSPISRNPQLKPFLKVNPLPVHPKKPSLGL